MSLRALLSIALFFIAVQARALTAVDVKGIAFGESDSRIEALNQAVASADDKTAAFFQAIADEAVKVVGQQVVIVRDGKAFDPVSGAALALPDGLEDLMMNNRLRGELDSALAALKLFSPDAKVRRAAIKQMQSDADDSKLPLIEKAYAVERDSQIKAELGLVRAAALLNSPDQARRLEAAGLLGASRQANTKTVLVERLQKETEPEVKAALRSSLREVEAALAWGDRLGALFSGISLGSILLLVALGLAITYGLMGVINMAHGELMMIGAYATYVVQGLFQKYAPGAFDWYLLAAVPAAFLASALMGAALERGVIRFLYGHLGHQPDADATGAQCVWCAKCRRGKPVLDEWRFTGAGQLVSTLQPAGDRGLCRLCVAGCGRADWANTPGAVCAWCYAKPADCRLHGGQYGTYRHIRLCIGLGHCRAGWVRLEPGR